MKNQLTPIFSIIIPTYNRPQRLATCLNALAQLKYAAENFEVIVVDDGSQVSLEPAIASFQDKLDLTVITQTNSGPAKARNVGAAAAKGQFLVFTDDDCTPDADWLTFIAEQLAAAPDCLVGGQTINVLTQNLCSTASQLLIDYLYHYYNSSSSQAHFFTSNNLALSAKLFHQMGGFNANFPLAAGEDRELCDRWSESGYSMIYTPEAIVYHAHQLTLCGFWRQHFNYGRGAYYFHESRFTRGANQITVEPVTFYLDLLKYPLTQKQVSSRSFITALFLVSQVANAAGFFKEYFALKPAGSITKILVTKEETVSVASSATENHPQ